MRRVPLVVSGAGVLDLAASLPGRHSRAVENGSMSTPSRPGSPRALSARPAAPRGTSPRAATPRSGVPRPAVPRPGVPRTAARPPAGPAARPGAAPPSGARRSTRPVTPLIEAAPPRGSWAAVMSWKTLVLAGVVALAVALVLPSVRVYMDQRQEIADLRAERDAAQAEVENLNAEIARWQDPAFIIAQARERLAYVFPGETPYRVVDPEVVRASAAGSAAALNAPDALESTPWFEDMWASIELVGNGPAAEEQAQP